MFSGIIEAIEPIVSSCLKDQVTEVRIRRPVFFNDVKVGDSIAVNGVCLTLESFDSESMFFTLTT
jgi:riboflavin synthase